MLRITHIVNPVSVGPKSDLFLAQPVTFASMEKARQLSNKQVQVSFHAVSYPEDESLIPTYFDSHTVLERSILDKGQFQKPRKLPLIHDIINTVAVDSFDYLIYTNVDIALMPWFYSVIAERISSGLEAFIINRRTISSKFTSPDDLEKMYVQAGESHPGMDCFVIKKDLLQNMDFQNVCIGVTFIGKVLEVNMLANADRFEHFKDDHLTFHLGDDRKWNNPMLSDYAEYNKKEFYTVLMTCLSVAEKNERREAIARIKDHLYKYFDWNEDGQNPYFQEPPSKRPAFKERIKRSIGALMGKT